MVPSAHHLALFLIQVGMVIVDTGGVVVGGVVVGAVPFCMSMLINTQPSFAGSGGIVSGPVPYTMIAYVDGPYSSTGVVRRT